MIYYEFFKYGEEDARCGCHEPCVQFDISLYFWKAIATKRDSAFLYFQTEGEEGDLLLTAQKDRYCHFITSSF